MRRLRGGFRFGVVGRPRETEVLAEGFEIPFRDAERGHVVAGDDVVDLKRAVLILTHREADRPEHGEPDLGQPHRERDDRDRRGRQPGGRGYQRPGLQR